MYMCYSFDQYCPGGKVLYLTVFPRPSSVDIWLLRSPKAGHFLAQCCRILAPILLPMMAYVRRKCMKKHNQKAGSMFRKGVSSILSASPRPDRCAVDEQVVSLLGS